jgi:small GTP-binding protein
MKIVLIGDTEVGKTSIVSRLVKGRFEDNCEATIGAALQNYIVQRQSGNVSLQIWDTAGQEKFRSLTPMYYRTANVAVLVYDITKQETFQGLESWVKEVTDKGPQGLKVVIVGNKKDIEEERSTSAKSGEDFCFRHQCCFFMEVSAKTGEGISELFDKIAALNETELRELNSEPIEIIPTKDTHSSSGCC